MREIYRKIVCAVIISADGKVLMGRKDPTSGGVYPDCWQIPGGGVEVGETNLAALRRELLEETGIDCAQYSPEILSDIDSASAPKRLAGGEEVLCHMKFFVYQMRIPLDAEMITVIRGTEFAEIAWHDKESICRISLVPAGTRLFRDFGNRIFSPHV